MFSNALNNVIAACEKLDDDKRWIELSARVQAGIMVVAVSNSAEKDVHERASVSERVAPSTDSSALREQPELKGHGWGLRILSALVAERNGTLTVSTEPGVFLLRMTLHV